MEDDRCPKICLREIIRGIKNKNKTWWGNGFRKRWNGSGEPTVVQVLLNEEANELLRKREDGIIKGGEQKIQLDLVKVQKSKYFPYHKEIKKNIGKENYLETPNISEWKRRIWTRASCGNIYNKRIREEETTEQEGEESSTDKLWKNLVEPLKEGRMEDDKIRRLKDEDEDDLEKTRKKREEGAKGSGATPTNEEDGEETEEHIVEIIHM